MSNKYNYPIKYVVLPVTTDLKYGYIKDRQSIIYFIVTKCFVTSKETKYLEDDIKERYKVVPPYTVDLKGDRMLPDYKFDECMNFLEKLIRMFLTSQMNNGMIEQHYLSNMFATLKNFRGKVL